MIFTWKFNEVWRFLWTLWKSRVIYNNFVFQFFLQTLRKSKTISKSLLCRSSFIEVCIVGWIRNLILFNKHSHDDSFHFWFDINLIFALFIKISSIFALIYGLTSSSSTYSPSPTIYNLQRACTHTHMNDFANPLSSISSVHSSSTVFSEYS